MRCWLCRTVHREIHSVYRRRRKFELLMLERNQAAMIKPPKKIREIHNHHMDSTIWNDFQFRDDDIIIATYGKSGTTWMQQIVAQLIFNGEENLSVPEMSPWLDLRFPPKEEKLAAMEAQSHRRFIKTHLPVDAFVFNPSVKHIYVARDGRDVAWSLFNHHYRGGDLLFEILNETPGLVGPPFPPAPEDPRAYFLEWLERDGYPWWPFWENILSWWNIRTLPNVTLMHFNDLKADMEGEIRRVADFLDIDVDAAVWPRIFEHCSFDYMKEHAAEVAPLGGAAWQGGAKSFIHKGTNRRWREALSDDDCENYERLVIEKLGAECAAWLKDGESARGR